MDLKIKASAAGQSWEMTDLLGRSMGHIVQGSDERFTIMPAGYAIDTMRAMNCGPFRSLDYALAEIEKHTRGTCRRDSADPDGGSIRTD